jgi:hypothetical protein
LRVPTPPVFNPNTETIVGVAWTKSLSALVTVESVLGRFSVAGAVSDGAAGSIWPPPSSGSIAPTTVGGPGIWVAGGKQQNRGVFTATPPRMFSWFNYLYGSGTGPGSVVGDNAFFSRPPNAVYPEFVIPFQSTRVLSGNNVWSGDPWEAADFYAQCVFPNSATLLVDNFVYWLVNVSRVNLCTIAMVSLINPGFLELQELVGFSSEAFMSGENVAQPPLRVATIINQPTQTLFNSDSDFVQYTIVPIPEPSDVTVTVQMYRGAVFNVSPSETPALVSGSPLWTASKTVQINSNTVAVIAFNANGLL